MKLHILVPAAGVGARFGASIPKQYAPFAGETVLSYTLNALLRTFSDARVYVAISAKDTQWGELALSSHPRITRVLGGETRAETVKLLVERCEPDAQDWLLIHDAVRPLLTAIQALSSIPSQLAQLAPDVDGLVFGQRVVETTKRTDEYDNIVSTLNRDGLWLAQTPQIFRADVLLTQLSKPETELRHTDEAALIEAGGGRIRMLDGSLMNLKITHAADLTQATLFLQLLSEPVGTERVAESEESRPCE